LAARHRLLSIAVLLAALIGVAVAGCGGGSEKDAKALLKRAFSESIPSANVTIDISAKIDGVPQLSQPIRLKLGGPFKSNGPKTIPSLNWDVSVSGGGQTFSAGLISTGDRAFVNFQGTNYEVGQDTMAQLKQAAASSGTSGSRSLRQFGVDPLAWVKDASEEGDSNVAGVATKHVSAGIDVAKLFADLNKVVSKAGGAVGSARPQQLTPQVIDSIKKVVHDPKFDVYVGKDDDKIRRASVSLQFTVPQQVQASARGVKGGNVTLSVEFAGVGEPQTIAAPANARPISELSKQLQGLGGALGAAGGIGGSGGSSGSGGTGGSGTPGGVPGGEPGTPGGGGKSPTSAQFQRYAQCLNKAKPSDTAALNRCSRLLK
jgi:hypothetical protein